MSDIPVVSATRAMADAVRKLARVFFSIPAPEAGKGITCVLVQTPAKLNAAQVTALENAIEAIAGAGTSVEVAKVVGNGEVPADVAGYTIHVRGRAGFVPVKNA